MHGCPFVVRIVALAVFMFALVVNVSLSERLVGQSESVCTEVG